MKQTPLHVYNSGTRKVDQAVWSPVIRSTIKSKTRDNGTLFVFVPVPHVCVISIIITLFHIKSTFECLKLIGQKVFINFYNSNDYYSCHRFILICLILLTLSFL